MVQIQLIDPQVGYLDVNETAEVPFTFSVADIRDITQKKSTVSKTIKLAGTKNNNILLNNYFDVNVEAGTFDINKIQKCQVIQDGIVIINNGILQLLSIQKVQSNISNDGLVEYDILIKDDVSDFFTTITNKTLNDIEFGDLDHLLTADNVISTFGNTWENGYKYVLPYSNQNEYSLNELKPAIFAKTIFDRIIEGAGFSYDFPSYSANTVQFDKLVIPYNGDQLAVDAQTIADNTVIVAKSGDTTISAFTLTSAFNTYDSYDQEIQDEFNRFNLLTGKYLNDYYVSNGGVLNFQIETTYQVSVKNYTTGTAYLVPSGPGFSSKKQYTPRIKLIRDEFGSGIVPVSNSTNLGTSPTDFQVSIGQTIAAGAEYDFGTFTTYHTIAQDVAIPGDLFWLDAGFVGTLPTQYSTSTIPSQPLEWLDANSTTGNTANVRPVLRITNLKLTIFPNTQYIGYNQAMRMNNIIPKQIKQSDFVKAICSMYNLFIINDPLQPNQLIFKHRDEFYDEGQEVDWSAKLAKDREQTITLLPQLSTKKVVLTYKQDDNDLFMKEYLKSTKEIYGQVEFTYDSEYVKNVETKELIFSPIVVGENTFGNVLPLINGVNPKTNIKIGLNSLQYTSTQPITIYNFSSSTLTGSSEVTTTIPLISHFDDTSNSDDSIAFFDLNYGMNDYYYYDLTTTNNNLYNLHWRRTINQINNGKMLTALFNLEAVDVNQLNLNQKVWLASYNSWWNINSIIDYKAGEKGLTKVELISVDDSLSFAPPIINQTTNVNPSDAAFSVFNEFIIQNNNDNNVNLSTGVVLFGRNNLVGDSANYSQINGNDNTINDRNSVVFGNGNALETTALVFGDNNTVTGINAVVFGNGISATTDNTMYANNIEVFGTINGLSTQILSGATLWSAGTGSDSIQANNPTGTLASGQYALAIGDNNVASGYAAVAEGRATDATGNLSHAGGYFTTTNNYNEWGRGHLIATGPSITGQYGFLNFVERTTNATPTEIFLDSNTQRMSIISGSVYHVAITLLGQNSSGDTYVSKWDGVIKNVSGTTSFVGTPMYSTIAVDTAMTGVTYTVSANNTNDALQIEVTGIASTTINWTATAQYTAIKTN